MFSLIVLVACRSSELSGAASAETVTVKYRGPVPLDTFACVTVDRSTAGLRWRGYTAAKLNLA